MRTLRKLLAIILGLISLALGFHFVVGELYGSYLPAPHLVWDYLNWPVGMGVVITLVFHFRRKRSLDRRPQTDAVSIEYISTNLMLFASIFLTLWFFANWFEEFNISDSTSPELLGFIWITFNGSFVLLGGATAWLLWNGHSEENTLSDSPGPLPQSPTGGQNDPTIVNPGASMAVLEGAEGIAMSEEPANERGESGSSER